MTNLKRLNGFFAAREAADDWCEYLNKASTQLSRQALLDGCQFPRSTLYQVAAVRERVAQIECDLARRGILQSPTSANLVEPYFDGEVDQGLDALNIRVDALVDGICEVRALIMSFDTDKVLGT